MIMGRAIVRAALVLGACAAIGGCASAAPPKVLKTAATSPEDAKPDAAATGEVPLTPVVMPGVPSPMAAFAKRLATVIDGSKPQVTTFPIDLDALPRVIVKAPLDAKEAAKLSLSKLKEDPDLTVSPPNGYARTYMLNFAFKESAKPTFGRIRVQGQYGLNEGWFGEGFGAQMSTYLTCAGATDSVPVHAASVRLEKDHAVYTMIESVLERTTCTVMSVNRWTVNAKPLLPRGILYGFRACIGSCTENEELTVIYPRASSAAGALGGGAAQATGSFSVVSFPIQKGGGGAFRARLNRRDADRWLTGDDGATKLDDKVLQLTMNDDALRASATYLANFELGIEVSQGADDEAPVAIAYTDLDPRLLPAEPTKAQSPAPAAPAARSPSRFGFSDPLSSRN